MTGCPPPGNLSPGGGQAGGGQAWDHSSYLEAEGVAHITYRLCHND